MTNDGLVLFAILLIALSAVLELKSNYVRAAVSSFGKARYLGYVGWVQYQARLFIMAAVSLVTVVFEARGFLDIQVFVLFSTGVSLILMFGYFYSRKFAALFDRLDRPMSMLNYREESANCYWRPMSFGRVQHIYFPFIVYFLLGVSVYVPFVLAAEFPQFRMTFAISGQLLNFFATVLMISVIEPRYLARVDRGDEADVACGMVFGRILAALFIFTLGCLL
jgi:hypothetical protein